MSQGYHESYFCLNLKETIRIKQLNYPHRKDKRTINTVYSSVYSTRCSPTQLLYELILVGGVILNEGYIFNFIHEIPCPRQYMITEIFDYPDVTLRIIHDLRLHQTILLQDLLHLISQTTETEF